MRTEPPSPVKEPGIPMDSCCHPLAAEGAPSLDLLLIFVTGLTISLGHCIGMCGPIQGA